MEPRVKSGELEVAHDSWKVRVGLCKLQRQDVLIGGSYKWESRHGYLRGEIFGEMYFFFMALTFFYLVLFLSGTDLACDSYVHATIPIFILGTIFMGFC